MVLTKDIKNLIELYYGIIVFKAFKLKNLELFLIRIDK
jgi:hypothetical protein